MKKKSLLIASLLLVGGLSFSAAADGNKDLAYIESTAAKLLLFSSEKSLDAAALAPGDNDTNTIRLRVLSLIQSNLQLIKLVKSGFKIQY